MTNHLQTLPRRAALSLVILGGLAAQAAGQVQITEYMYSGLDGEFIELTNVSALPVDLEDWSLDDKSAIPGTYDLSLAGIIDPGESVLVTDRIASNFSASWSLGATTVLGGNAIASLGRNDEIHVFDAAGATVDVLAFGDDDFPGSLRARNASAQGCDAGLGGDDIYRWTLALEGDAWGSRVSLNGDVGSPGLHGPVTCPPVGVAFCVAAFGLFFCLGHFLVTETAALDFFCFDVLLSALLGGFLDLAWAHIVAHDVAGVAFFDPLIFGAFSTLAASVLGFLLFVARPIVAVGCKDSLALLDDCRSVWLADCRP